MNITQSQRDKMLHAIGGRLDGPGTRNYYCAGNVDPEWEILVEAGLAVLRDRGEEFGGIYYHLTERGYEALRDKDWQIKIDSVRWLRSNAELYRRRGGPSLTIAENMEACAKKMEEMQKALMEMAMLKLRDEMTAEDLTIVDYGAGYEMLVEKARRVVGVQAGGNG